MTGTGQAERLHRYAVRAELSMFTRPVLEAVLEERVDQQIQWGHQEHTWPEWISILGEEFGEAAQVANHLFWGNATTPAERAEKLGDLRLELIQVTAVAVQIVEHIDDIQRAEDQ